MIYSKVFFAYLENLCEKQQYNRIIFFLNLQNMISKLSPVKKPEKIVLFSLNILSVVNIYKSIKCEWLMG